MKIWAGNCYIWRVLIGSAVWCDLLVNDTAFRQEKTLNLLLENSFVFNKLLHCSSVWG